MEPLKYSFCCFLAPAVDIKNESSEYVSQELSKSDRPELTAAKTVISGGKWCMTHMYFNPYKC